MESIARLWRSRPPRDHDLDFLDSRRPVAGWACQWRIRVKPTFAETEKSDLDLRWPGTRDAS